MGRPLKRVIQKEIENPLGRVILEGRIMDREKVQVDKGKRGLEFRAMKKAGAARDNQA